MYFDSSTGDTNFNEVSNNFSTTPLLNKENKVSSKNLDTLIASEAKKSIANLAKNETVESTLNIKLSINDRSNLSSTEKKIISFSNTVSEFNIFNNDDDEDEFFDTPNEDETFNKINNYEEDDQKRNYTKKEILLNKNSITASENEVEVEKVNIFETESDINATEQKTTLSLKKTSSDIHFESFSLIQSKLKDRNILSDSNILKNKFESIFRYNNFQTEKEHLKLLKRFLKESAVEGLLTKNNQPLTREETADLYRSLKKSFIELYVANPHLFANQSQKKDKKQEVPHLETLNSHSRQKTELYVYEPIDIAKENDGKNSTSKKVHLFAVDLQHEAKIESKKEIKKKLIKEKIIDKQFLKRNEFKYMANELVIKENILKNINLTSQLSRNTFNSTAPTA